MISLTSPVKTKAHSWPAGAKLFGLCAVTMILFFVENLALQGAFFAFVLILYGLAGRRFFIAGMRQLRLLWPFVVIVGIWHVWTGDYGVGGIVILRLLSAVAFANLITMTTRLSDMIDVLRVLTGPLSRLGLRANVLELAIALVIRLTPVLVQKGALLSEAWRARSPRKAAWHIILPFTVLALDDADHVAEALRARGGFDSLENI
ncbi:MAG: energy-coupling factor transporter transmembrane component T family protein [Paracoccaceae bacterium]